MEVINGKILSNLNEYYKLITPNFQIKTLYADYYSSPRLDNYFEYLLIFDVLDNSGSLINIISQNYLQYQQNFRTIIQTTITEVIKKEWIKKYDIELDIINIDLTTISINHRILFRVYKKYIKINDIEAYRSIENNQLLGNLKFISIEKRFDRDSSVYTFIRTFLELEIEKGIDINNQSLFLSVSYLDSINTYLSLNTDEQDLPLKSNKMKDIIYVCLFLAAKFNSDQHYGIDDFEKLLGISRDEIIKLEKNIYTRLNGDLIFPTSYNTYQSFKYRLLSINNIMKEEESNYTEFLLYYILMNIDFIIYNPSILAISSMYISSRIFGNVTKEDKIFEKISGYVQYEILNCSYYILSHLKSKFSDNSGQIDPTKPTSINKYQFLIKKYSIDVRQFLTINIDKFFFNTESKSINRVNYNYEPDTIIKVPNIETITSVKLGRGAYGNVYKVIIDGKNIEKAIKIAFCRDDGLDPSIIREIAMLKFTSNSNIIYNQYLIYGSMNGMSCDGFAMELMDTSLFGEIVSRSKNKTPFNEYLLKEYSKQLIDGVNYLHQRGIIHRDIKPENILLRGSDLKISDFGLARAYTTFDHVYKDPAFSVFYMPPELLKDKYIENTGKGEGNKGEEKSKEGKRKIKTKEYSFKADVWSVGCVIGELTKLRRLFEDKQDELVLNHILLVFGTEEMKKINMSYMVTIPPIDFGSYINSKDKLFIDMVQQMLKVNPSERSSMERISYHPWFTS